MREAVEHSTQARPQDDSTTRVDNDQNCRERCRVVKPSASECKGSKRDVGRGRTHELREVNESATFEKQGDGEKT